MADELPSGFRRIEIFDEVNVIAEPGLQLQAIRSRAPEFQSWFRAQGTAVAVETCDLVATPFPREYALWRAALSPTPFVRIYNRMMVVRFDDFDGVRRTLLVEPTDSKLAENTPFFRALADRFGPRMRDLAVVWGPTVAEHLARLGIDRAEIDYITFDHLHVQDLRPHLGTTTPQPGLGAPDRPLDPLFPNAKLLVMRPEWELMQRLHPLQRNFFQPETYRDLRTDNVVCLDGDVLLGPGVALIATPGHTIGNQTLVLNTDSGIWTQSENGVHPESYQPEQSRIPGLARWARSSGQEVVINANTPELAALHYNSMVKEKLIADRGGPGGGWVQHFASSELTPWKLAPLVSPSFTYGALRHGSLKAE
ncbi:hypothetical protein [Actinomadura rayongensis]|uniref:MBL fold metallo-hydrolase n=1 Tax=Actinomadura rayongensis TaxID=1429076 RepID=A0A6I4W6T4_9ACTN|nr:hypothetical protein [Actinomadura rayongensis]MXQ65221.1 hypothetical protein [Actinomadura rayongensis]